MCKTFKQILGFVFLLVFATLGVWTVQAKLDPLLTSVQVDKDQISSVIDSYFKARYDSFSTLQSENFGTIVSDDSEGKAFLQAEQDKRAVELYSLQVNKLRYLKYTYYLDNKIINLDPLVQTAVVSLDEGYDVVFESLSPMVSKMRGLHHIIRLQKIGDAWKIVDDQYHDDLWNFIRGSGKSKSDLLASIDTMSQKLTIRAQKTLGNLTSQQAPSSNLLANNSYDRLGAVRYADQWALSRNTASYDDFSDLGGDCTNFISQAMYEGGQAPMVNPTNGAPTGIGTTGWYYNDINHRAKAWTLVDEMHNFLVTENYLYSTGLVGQDSDYEHMELGDVIQLKNYDKDRKLIWTHGMIVSGFLDPYVVPYPLVVDAHSTDYLGRPLGLFSWVEIRFIHITSIKRPAAFLPSIVNNDVVASMSSQARLQNPYPAPLESVTPPIGSNSGSKAMAYPAP